MKWSNQSVPRRAAAVGTHKTIKAVLPVTCDQLSQFVKFETSEKIVENESTYLGLRVGLRLYVGAGCRTRRHGNSDRYRLGNDIFCVSTQRSNN